MDHSQKLFTMFDMALSFLYDSQLEDALAKVQKRIIQRRGEQDGRAAGTWYFNEPSDEETDRWIKKGIEDGDPEILDTFPQPRINGEWADDSTWTDILREELNIDPDHMRFGLDDDLNNAYVDAFCEGVHKEIDQTLTRRIMRYDLGMMAE